MRVNTLIQVGALRGIHEAPDLWQPLAVYILAASDVINVVREHVQRTLQNALHTQNIDLILKPCDPLLHVLFVCVHTQPISECIHVAAKSQRCAAVLQATGCQRTDEWCCDIAGRC